MFEVGFSELLMTGLVALIVIGPEKLPKAARVAGLWVARINQSLSSIKADIRQELHAEEMRQLWQENSIAQDVQHLVDQANNAVLDAEHAVSSKSESGSNDADA